MSRKKLPITIYRYLNYRIFLSDLFGQWGKNVYRWSYAKFSNDAGFAVSNYLKLIIDGDKNLGKVGIDKITKYFKFNKQESSFFFYLVKENQAKNGKDKEKFFQKIIKHSGYLKYCKDDVNIHRLYSKWYNPLIRELVNIKGFKSNPKWVAKQLLPNISEAEAKKSLEFLIESGHLIKDIDGNLQQSNPVSSTGKESTAIAVGRYHKEMIQKAKESISNFSQNRRNISSLTMAVSDEVYDDIVNEIYQFQNKIIKMVNSQTSAPDDVCQLNFQIFPLSQVKKNRDENEK